MQRLLSNRRSSLPPPVLACLMVTICAIHQPALAHPSTDSSETLTHQLTRTPQPTQELVAGMEMERALSPPDEHVYTARFEDGAAILGHVHQDAIDLVIDVYGPDNQLITRLDSPIGDPGSGPIDFTALETGTHRFVVRAADNRAKPGKYVIKVTEILGPVENAKRLAKDHYPSKALYDLWETSLTDQNAVERIISSRQQSGPIFEDIPGSPLEMQVTYFCLGDQDTQSVELVGGPDFMGLDMSRLGKTKVFFVTQIVPKDARFIYAFNIYKVHRAGPKRQVEVQETVHTNDSILEMPNAPPQPYVNAKQGIPRGKSVQATIKSTLLNEDRKITVYLPAGYDGKTQCNLLVVFDGVTYGGLPDQAQAEVPSLTIMDNLIAEKRIGPTVAILVWSMGKRNRDLTGSKPFADFVATELVPWARSKYKIHPGPKNVTVAGSSLGGFCATYCAFTHSEAIGNVVSQSGSYWISKNWQTVDAQFHHRLYPRDTGTMIEEFKRSKHLPIRFYLEVGVYDMGAAMLGSNRELRDVLQLKGYDVDYHEFAGGHNTVNWRGSLADGLISVLGRRIK